ncbi:hypothetical protein NIES2111_47780 [Nostoc sp. NIES-2111]|nr:hypothetical protein NIES2111_47780 [Nostoc sp. NIES-2111]
MGIGLSYRRVTLEEFEKLHNDATYASLYFGDALETDEEIYAYYEELENSDRYLDLDKYWQPLHFIFTGEFPYDGQTNNITWLHKMFMEGTVTNWEATYGMVRYFTADEVQVIAQMLNNISNDDLQQALNKLFSSNESRAYMEPHYINLYTQVINFFSKAAHEGEIILVSFD